MPQICNPYLWPSKSILPTTPFEILLPIFVIFSATTTMGKISLQRKWLCDYSKISGYKRREFNESESKKSVPRTGFSLQLGHNYASYSEINHIQNNSNQGIFNDLHDYWPSWQRKRSRNYRKNPNSTSELNIEEHFATDNSFSTGY